MYAVLLGSDAQSSYAQRLCYHSISTCTLWAIENVVQEDPEHICDIVSL